MKTPLESRPRFQRVLWIAFALLGMVGAFAVSPARLVNRLPPEAEGLRQELALGVNVVRLGMAGASVLALISLAVWGRGVSGSGVQLGPGQSADSEADVSRPQVPDFLFAGLLLALSLILLVPQLGNSLWEDELTTVVRIARRSVPVILSWSCVGNNHVLNSLLIKASLFLFGEGELQIHLTAFLFALATPQVVFWSLRKQHGRDLAVLSGILTCLSFWVVRHGVEARGYSGAILFSTLASFLFARLLQRPTAGVVLSYILCSIAAAGFVATSMVVPFTQGLIAVAFFLNAWFRKGQSGPARLDAVLACLWVAVGFLIFFGLPIPQLMAYARTNALNDHLAMGPTLLGEVGEYLTSTKSIPVAIVMAAVAIVGWFAYRADPCLGLSFLTPGLVAVVLLCLPKSTASPRLFCFMLVPIAMGIAGAFARSNRPVLRGLCVCVGVIWMGSLGLMHWELIRLKTPNLKDLASRTSGSRIVLIGDQFDMITYYFPDAECVNRRTTTLSEGRPTLEQAEVIIQGYVEPAVPSREILELGFSEVERLVSFHKDQTSFRVYRR